ncbi:MAG: phytanoyl-CoA dioxygenase family protein [Microcoleaceae cyanobacterium]
MFWTAFKSGGTRVYFEYYAKLQEPDSYEPKIVVDAEYQLTAEEIRFFYENAYLGPFELIPPEEMEGIKEHLLNLVKTESKILSYSTGDLELMSGGNHGKNYDDLSKNEKYYVNLLNGFERHLEDSVYLNLFKHPAVTERISQIIGPDLLLWHCNHFGIDPHSKGTAPHQASRWLSFDMKESALEPTNEEQMFEVNCWIALTDAPEERGCLSLIPGSQKEIYPMKVKGKQVSSGDKGIVYGRYDAEMDYPINSQNIKPLPAKAGQFYLFSGRAIHGSTDNITDEKRWAVGGHFIKADTKVFTKNMLENGLTHEVYGFEKVKLDKWKPVLVRSENPVKVKEMSVGMGD